MPTAYLILFSTGVCLLFGLNITKEVLLSLSGWVASSTWQSIFLRRLGEHIFLRYLVVRFEVITPTAPQSHTEGLEVYLYFCWKPLDKPQFRMVLTMLVCNRYCFSVHRQLLYASLLFSFSVRKVHAYSWRRHRCRFMQQINWVYTITSNKDTFNTSLLQVGYARIGRICMPWYNKYIAID